MQVPEIGISTQRKLKQSKIGIVDGDTVDVTNLHRQVLHNTETVGMLKCESAKRNLLKLNPNVEIQTYPELISNENAFKIISQYDYVLDCTDNPATRYLINDVSVLCGKTIISGSGVKTDGQLCVLNFHNVGPCYRCFYPTPPPANSVTSCADGGVVGSCIGLVGIMMATETLKVISGFYNDDNFKPYLALYSGFGPNQSLRTFKMRSKSNKCKVCCDEQRQITKKLIEKGELDYHTWCGSVDYNVLKLEERIDVQQLKMIIDAKKEAKSGFLLLDVRPKEQFEIGSIPNTRNIPYSKLNKCKSLEDVLPDYDDDDVPVYVICRFGRDSQLSVRYLKDQLGLKNVWDIKGGVNKWASDVDEDFPVYW
ncbi:unnamed protein product [Ambrosiozyma monospora]|uniref:Unnamed protein product n=1 Tax=Ambrosiozyma monospora TaxID=43982 RepID=A0ACB5TTS3_AMBMO|nr:unnamed protein product [Ambrosiozyma monospora]